MTRCPAASEGYFRTGIIGLGRAGWDIHARMLRGDGRFRIAAVSDPEPGRQEQARAELACSAFSTPEEMLEHEDLDLVIVASPSVFHKAHAILALESGAHVVVEKPLAANAEQVDAMIDAARAAERHLLPYQPRRLGAMHQQIKQTVESGSLGRLIHVAYRRHNYIRRNDWQCVLAYGGGMLSNHGSHVLDQILDLLQSPVQDLICRLDRIASAGDAEDHVTLLLQTASNVTVHVEISDGAATTASMPEWTLLGEHGALTATGTNGIIRCFDPTAVPARDLQPSLAARGRVYGSNETLPWVQRAVSVDHLPDLPYYDAVHATLAKGRPFIFPVEQVREVIALLDRCRSQNPGFLHPTTRSPHDGPSSRATRCVRRDVAEVSG